MPKREGALISIKSFLKIAMALNMNKRRVLITDCRVM
jgi:hypothetical protein